MSLLKYSRIGAQVAKALMLRKNIPVFISYMITWRCNFKCQYCNVWRKDEDELTTDQICTMIDTLYDCGTRSISFNGGEPLIRSDIGSVTNYCSNKGIYTKILTNGFLIKEKINEIKELDLIQISFDGPRAVHDKQRHAGSYDAILAAVGLLKRHKMNIGLHCVITKYNIDCLNEVLDIAKELGVIVSLQPLEQRYGFNEFVRDNSPNREELRRALTNIVEQKKKGNKHISNSLQSLELIMNHWPNPPLSKCWAGRVHYRITPEGRFTPCDRVENAPSILSPSASDLKQFISKRGSIGCSEQCWCHSTIELNYLLSFNPRSLWNFKGLIYQNL